MLTGVQKKKVAATIGTVRNIHFVFTYVLFILNEFFKNSFYDTEKALTKQTGLLPWTLSEIIIESIVDFG